MSIVSIRSFTCIALLMLIANHAFAQQAKPSNREILRTKQQRFLNYGKDFVALRGSARTESERAAIYGLGHTAATVYDYASSAGALLYIYDRLSCQSDRDNTLPVVKDELSYFVMRLDSEIDNINTELSFINSPAVATSGTQMKEDLRELKKFFESMRSN